MKATDRKFKVYEVSPLLAKEFVNVSKLLPKVTDMLMITQVLEDRGISYGDGVCTLDEQRSALIELLKIVVRSEDIGDFDISMAGKAVLHSLDLDRMIISWSEFQRLNRLGVVDKIINENRGVVRMEKEITTGSIIVDRDGNKYTAYSYLVAEFNEAMELLEKVDTFNMLENHDDESFAAMVEIVYRALDRRYSKEELLKFIDAEFIQKVIRCYFALSQVA